MNAMCYLTYCDFAVNRLYKLIDTTVFGRALPTDCTLMSNVVTPRAKLTFGLDGDKLVQEWMGMESACEFR